MFLVFFELSLDYTLHQPILSAESCRVFARSGLTECVSAFPSSSGTSGRTPCLVTLALAAKVAVTLQQPRYSEGSAVVGYLVLRPRSPTFPSRRHPLSQIFIANWSYTGADILLFHSFDISQYFTVFWYPLIAR